MASWTCLALQRGWPVAGHDQPAAATDHDHHPTGAERLAFDAVVWLPESLPDPVDLTDEELRESLQTTMLRILRIPS